MSLSLWFDGVPVLGKLPPIQAAAKLREIGDKETAEVIESSEIDVVRSSVIGGWLESLWPSNEKPWRHTSHTFGYLGPSAPGGNFIPIHHAGNIVPDITLRNKRIRITLDRLRVGAYPGGGTHRVLFDFYAQNQVPTNVEHLHFAATYRVREGEQAAIIGYPLFSGLNVGTEGVAFKCFTVNVKNDEDEAFLDFLESDVFKAGLKLVSTAQPAIGPLSQMALGLTKTIAGRHKNVPVQDFYMGLDFSTIPTRARLAEGAYLAVQIPESLETTWNWTDWVFDPSTGQVVNRAEGKRLIPFNYLVFSVSRYTEGR
ncbi:MAG TPA: hypothetical protein VIJ01_13430 [Candidatus Angelobacter sp.]